MENKPVNFAGLSHPNYKPTIVVGVLVATDNVCLVSQAVFARWHPVGEPCWRCYFPQKTHSRFFFPYTSPVLSPLVSLNFSTPTSLLSFASEKSWIEGMDACSCPQPDTTGCSNCRHIRFRHHVLCTKGDNAPEMSRLCQFELRDDCPFCSIVTRAFHRLLVTSGKEGLLTPARVGQESRLLDAKFLLSEGLIPWDSNNSGDSKTRCVFLYNDCQARLSGVAYYCAS
jgi:hypothetical protein